MPERNETDRMFDRVPRTDFEKTRRLSKQIYGIIAAVLPKTPGERHSSPKDILSLQQIERLFAAGDLRDLAKEVSSQQDREDDRRPNGYTGYTISPDEVSYQDRRGGGSDTVAYYRDPKTRTEYILISSQAASSTSKEPLSDECKLIIFYENNSYPNIPTRYDLRLLSQTPGTPMVIGEGYFYLDNKTKPTAKIETSRTIVSW